MRDLNYGLKQLCKDDKRGSFAYRANRNKILQLAANELYALGYQHMTVKSLKPKHVLALISHWKEKNITVGTIKNRLVHLRWWAKLINKPEIIPPNNAALNIANRVYKTNEDKSCELTEDIIDKVTDPFVAVSLQLQQVFGLRREEAIKFIPSWADRGDKIVLKSTWCKGGKERVVFIRNDEQRRVLKLAHQRAKQGSLIPSSKKYVYQMKVFERQCLRAGLNGSHGLRHRYAQIRYKEIVGWECPARGGLTRKQLSPEQKKQDRDARLLISKELGHERESITNQYLGR